MIVSYSALETGLHLFDRKKVIVQFKTREKIIGYRIRLQENDDLPLWRAPAIKKKKPPYFYVRALITREILRSKDAQCNIKNDLPTSTGLTKVPGFFESFPRVCFQFKQ